MLEAGHNPGNLDGTEYYFAGKSIPGAAIDGIKKDAKLSAEESLLKKEE